MNRSAILSIFSVVMVLAAGCGYSETDCIPNDHTQCIESVSYWMDSCGVQGQMAEVCDCGCNDDYSGCRQPTDLHAHVSCHDGIEYWVDDCGSEGSIKQTCDCGCNPGSTACQDPCDCTPDCGIRECGPVPNGCGDSCGSCDANETCEDGTCTPQSSSPVIIDLSSNTSVMNENSTLIITAIVTDPQGIGDLIGGSLKNVSETLSYGAFSTSGEEGSYQITLYWDDLDTVEAVWAERAGRERVFKALFYDQAGHMASDNISVTLQCTAGRAACDGDCLDHQDICDGGNTCIDVGSDPTNCGACDFSCAAVSNGDPICVSELCDVDCHDGYARCGETECREALSDDSNCGGCDQFCDAAEDCLYGNCIDDSLTVTTISGTTSISIFADETRYFIIEVQAPTNLEVEWENAGYVCDCDYSLWVVDDIDWNFIDSEYNWSNECTQWGYNGDLSPGTYIYMMGGCHDGIGSVNFHLTPITR